MPRFATVGHDAQPCTEHARSPAGFHELAHVTAPDEGADAQLHMLPDGLHHLVHEVVDDSQGSIALRHFDRAVCARLAALPYKQAELALSLLADRSAWMDGADLLAELEDAL